MEDLKGIVEVRHVEKIRARFCIVDSKELLFMLMDDSSVHSSYDVGIWVNTSFFVEALLQLFDLAWVDMKKPNLIIK